MTEIQEQRYPEKTEQQREQFNFLIETYLSKGDANTKETFLSLVKSASSAEISVLDQDLNLRYSIPNITRDEKMRVLELKAGILNIKKDYPLQNTSVETIEKPIPFEILWWSMKVRLLIPDGGTHEEDFFWRKIRIPNLAKTEDREVWLSPGNLPKRISPNEYEANLNFHNQETKVSFRYFGNNLSVKYGYYDWQTVSIDDRQKKFIQPMANGGQEISIGTTPVSLKVWEMTLKIGNFLQE